MLPRFFWKMEKLTSRAKFGTLTYIFEFKLILSLNLHSNKEGKSYRLAWILFWRDKSDSVSIVRYVTEILPINNCWRSFYNMYDLAVFLLVLKILPYLIFFVPNRSFEVCLSLKLYRVEVLYKN